MEDYKNIRGKKRSLKQRKRSRHREELRKMKFKKNDERTTKVKSVIVRKNAEIEKKKIEAEWIPQKMFSWWVQGCCYYKVDFIFNPDRKKNSVRQTDVKPLRDWPQWLMMATPLSHLLPHLQFEGQSRGVHQTLSLQVIIFWCSPACLLSFPLRKRKQNKKSLPK